MVTPRRVPLAQTRKHQRAAGVVVPDPDGPLTAMEQQPAILHCDRCEHGEPLHLLWRSVDGFPLAVRCVRHAGDA